MITDRVAKALRRAEEEVSGLIGEAATSADYEMVVRLGNVARKLAALSLELRDGVVVTGTAAKLPSLADPAAITAGVRRLDKTNGRRTSRKEGYPKFERSRDQLVKIGWSKKDRSEYVHKAPRAGLDRVVKRVVELGTGGRMFSTEELLPVRISDGGDELPYYQAYLCLAWLREIGLIEQHGREGYSVVGDDLAGSVNRIWSTTPTSRR